MIEAEDISVLKLDWDHRHCDQEHFYTWLDFVMAHRLCFSGAASGIHLGECCYKSVGFPFDLPRRSSRCSQICWMLYHFLWIQASLKICDMEHNRPLTQLCSTNKQQIWALLRNISTSSLFVSNCESRSYQRWWRTWSSAATVVDIDIEMDVQSSSRVREPLVSAAALLDSFGFEKKNSQMCPLCNTTAFMAHSNPFEPAFASSSTF